MNYKTISIKDYKKFQDPEDSNKIYITGYANTKNVADSYGDIPTNFKGEPVYDIERMESNPVCFVDHWASASNIAGNFVELKEDKIGLWFKLLLRSLDSVFSDDVKDAISAFTSGFGKALSIGGNWVFGDGDNPNHITRATINEVSIVGLGADSRALTNVSQPKNINMNIKIVVPFQDFPLADRETEWDKSEAAIRVIKFTNSEESPSPSYKNAFLWYDKENAENFGAYKFPVADVIDSSLKAVPRAIFNAAARLNQSTISDADKKGIEAHLSKYYKKLGIDSPFTDKGFKISNINDFDVRTIENLLVNGSCFSNKEAKTLISMLKKAGSFRDESNYDRDGHLKNIGQELENILLKIKGNNYAR